MNGTVTVRCEKGRAVDLFCFWLVFLFYFIGVPICEREEKIVMFLENGHAWSYEKEESNDEFA